MDLAATEDSSPSAAQPTSTAPHARALWLPPTFVAHDDGDCLSFVELPSPVVIELRGTLRAAFLESADSPALRAMALHNERLARLLDARRQGPLSELRRAELMRGAGYGQLFIELTAQCNERCAHCYADSSPTRNEALDWPTLRAVLDDARALGFARVQLTGGDPLVSEHCLPAAQYAHELGIPGIEIYTNGIALYGSLYEGLRRLPVSFAFSFYSHDAAVHDAITGTRGSQRRTLAAIERVLEDGLPVRVNLVVMDENRAGAAATLALLQELGVPGDRIGMDVQRSVGRGEMTIEPGASDLPRLPGGHRVADRERFAGRAAVSYDGQVYPCIFSRSFPLGNVRAERLSSILLAPEPLRVDRDRIVLGTSLRAEELACWDCRLRAALLPEDTLVSLRRKERA